MENIDLKFISKYLNIKLLLITTSTTIGFLFCISKNNIILKRKY